MFKNGRYITRGVQLEIPIELQLFMWSCIDSMSKPKDYFQVFKLEKMDGKQNISHSSEQPDYHMEYLFPSDNPITEKLYIIDDGEHSTMLLANEY